jgi:hypothetical protein
MNIILIFCNVFRFVTVDLSILKNKKFWEQLIAYFPLILHGPHRKRRLQQIFVAPGKSLLRCYLVTIRGYTDRPTDTRVQKFFYCRGCIRCRGNVLTEPLPGNDRRHIHTDSQTDGREFMNTPLRWARVPCYTYQVS